MRLVSRILAVDVDGALAEAVVSEGWPACTGRGADPALGVELIAQTAAAWFALREAAEAPEPGLLVGVSRAHFRELRFRVGDVLHIHVREVWSRDGLCQIAGQIMKGDEELALAEVQVLRGQAASEALPSEREEVP